MIRNIATVMRGTVLAQGLGILILPLVTRLFDPTAFGHLQLYLSVVTLLIVAPSLRYDIAIMRATEAELPALLRLCVYANVGVAGLLLAIGYAIAAIAPGGWLATAPFPLWLPIAAMMISGIAQVLLYVATREERFGVNANSKVAQAVSYAGGGVGLGVAGAGSNGLIFADLLGRLTNLGWLFAWFRRRPRQGGDGVALGAVARRYREYPLIALPGGIVNSAGGVLTPIMVYATFSAATAGQYGLVDRAMTLPVALIAIAVSQVFMAQLATALRTGGDGALAQYRHVLRWLAMLGAAPALAVLLLAEPVFVLVFGPDWRLAGRLAEIMAPAAFTTLLSGCFNMTLTVVGRQKTQIGWEIGRLAAMVALWSAVSTWRLPVLTAVAFHSGLLVAINGVFLLLCDRALHHATPQPVEPAFVEGGAA